MELPVTIPKGKKRSKINEKRSIAGRKTRLAVETTARIQYGHTAAATLGYTGDDGDWNRGDDQDSDGGQNNTLSGRYALNKR
mmetsp:Transcript_19590/g.28490  ORF Transcript_19590/g.28490 Transcript_19590/m.28490 type:complete len:82 (-) Transcript_19590:514-759(-)